jgi:signal transduction histidine kinase
MTTPSREDVEDLCSIGSFSYDPATGEMGWSPMLYHLLGVDPGRAAGTPERLRELLGVDLIAELSRRDAAEPTSNREATYRVTRPGGEVRYLQILTRRSSGSGGGAGPVIGVVRDVTQVRRLEDQLLHHRDQSLAVVIAGMAHDINNLMTVIGVNVTLAHDLASNSPAAPMFDDIHDGLARAAALTRQLINLVRRRAAGDRLVRVVDVVRGSERLLCRLLPAGVHLDVDVTDDAGWVRMETSDLERVILNLVLNARDALPSGGTINLRTGSAAPDLAVIEVADDGIGMDDEVRRRLFEPFFTTKPDGQGSGLGLANCRTLIQQAGGHLSVASAAGRGSVFRVHLPRWKGRL